MNQPPPGAYDPYDAEPTARMRATPPGASGSAPSNQSYPPTVPDQLAYRAGPGRQPARMPRARALEVTRRFKTALIAGSVMAFGVLTALVAGHTTGVTARGASNGSSGAPAPTSAPSNDDSGGFFNSAPSTSGNGGFGVSPSAPSQPPVSGSSVS